MPMDSLEVFLGDFVRKAEKRLILGISSGLAMNISANHVRTDQKQVALGIELGGCEFGHISKLYKGRRKRMMG